MNSGAGKGKGPIKGYNYKNWNKHFNAINWHNKWCPLCGKWTDHLSGSHYEYTKERKK
jgi:hypothetical protein